MIYTKEHGQNKHCLSKSEPTFFKVDEPIRAINCVDAIVQLDTREILVIEDDLIKLYMDELCIGTSKKGDTEVLIVNI